MESTEKKEIKSSVLSAFSVAKSFSSLCLDAFVVI